MARPSKPKTELAQRLITVRGELTRTEFCRKLGISDSTYATYERGDRTPDTGLLAQLMNDWDVDLNWLLTGEGAPTRSQTKTEKPEQLPATSTIDPDLLKQVARIVSRVHAEAEIRLPADAQATELANAYNLLMAKAEDPADPLELKSLLPWLETHLTKTLRQALKEPGAGKREA
jgi:transcriptional regulator with XRE-family HTH domain